MKSPAFRSQLKRWRAPAGWERIETIDAHTGGEPLRVIVSGFPEIPGDSILAQRAYLRKNLDHLRKGLMWEPRGHADMYGCLLVPPERPDSAFGVLFMHNEGYSTMCGHGILAVVRVALETGLLPRVLPVTRVKIDAPAGQVTAEARFEGNELTAISFLNVPAFVLHLGQDVTVSGFGRVPFDVAFGGAFYAFVRTEDVGLRGVPEEYRRLIELGTAIKQAVSAAFPILHPFHEDLSFLYGTILTTDSPRRGTHSRHVCVFAEGEVDRSPTGTGVSARLALDYARRKLARGESITIESIVGSSFRGRVRDVTRFGPYEAVIPEVEGMAYICARNEFLFDPADPFRTGFFLR